MLVLKPLGMSQAVEADTHCRWLRRVPYALLSC